MLDDTQEITFTWMRIPLSFINKTCNMYNLDPFSTCGWARLANGDVTSSLIGWDLAQPTCYEQESTQWPHSGLKLETNANLETFLKLISLKIFFIFFIQISFNLFPVLETKAVFEIAWWTGARDQQKQRRSSKTPVYAGPKDQQLVLFFF